MAEICLLLEGTFPYVTGGVSTCVYQLIRETPQVDYFILFIGANKSDKREYKYPIPSNVLLIKELNLFDYNIQAEPKPLNVNFDWNVLYEFHEELKRGDFSKLDYIMQTFFDPYSRVCDPNDIFSSQEAWALIEKLYKKVKPGPSFIDFFYTWRFTHYPFFQVLGADIPRASLYHSLSTGYAGLLGATAKMRYKMPFFLTEHGIYTHERKIEISMANWIASGGDAIQAQVKNSFFKEWWMNLFKFMSYLAYDKADVISTLFLENKNKQIAYGAAPEKVRVIPNGVNFDMLSSLKRNETSEKLIIGLVGRVVPIKDIKTFIKSIALLKQRCNREFNVLILGPTDEDFGYFQECLGMVRLYGLEDVISFPGRVDVKQYYPKIDILILSSISEGQPMVILEGFCLGIPVVATNVGSCRELIYGMTDADRALGQAGLVVPFGQPDQLADAMQDLLVNDEKRKEFGANGKKRVERYYREQDTVKNYLLVYNELFTEGLT